MSADSRRRMSEAAKRRPSNRLGKRHTEETRRLISERTRERTARGVEHYAWQGGITPKRRAGRKLPGYKAWRREVRERAGGVCECCLCDRGKCRMFAHHIHGYASHPELALDPENGAWLCDDCHRGAHA